MASCGTKSVVERVDSASDSLCADDADLDLGADDALFSVPAGADVDRVRLDVGLCRADTGAGQGMPVKGTNGTKDAWLKDICKPGSE